MYHITKQQNIKVQRNTKSICTIKGKYRHQIDAQLYSSERSTYLSILEQTWPMMRAILLVALQTGTSYSIHFPPKTLDH